MTTDPTEGGLRTALADAVAEVAPHLRPPDLEDVLRTAASDRRTRRTRLTAGVGAVVVLAALAVAVGVGRNASEDSGPAEVATGGSVRLHVDGFNGRGEETVVEVSFRAAGPNTTTVTFTKVLDGRAYPATRMTLTHGQQSLVELRPGDDLAVGVVPSRAVATALLGEGNAYPITAPVPLGTTGWSADAYQLDRTRAPGGTLRAMWWLADGTPGTNDETGRSATFATKDGERQVWVLPAEGIMGLRTSGAATTSALRRGAATFDRSTTGSKADLAVVIRDRVSHVVPTYVKSSGASPGGPAAGDTPTTVQVRVLGDGWTAVLVHGEVDPVEDDLVAALTWTGSDGRTHSAVP